MSTKIIGATVGTTLSPSKIEDKLNPVKSVNGVKPDDNGNVEIVGNNGADGKDGADGKSAYQIAKDNGFEGTEVEWLESLKGKDGADGKDGANGADGTDGKDGTNGIDGKTPYINNGNWWIGDTDTGVKAEGVDGADGKDGEKGEKGDQGEQGIQGIQGEKGEKGDTGSQGSQGEKGDKGDKGADGVSATHSWNGTILTITSASGSSSVDLKGDKGDKGDQGIQGIQGEKGETGANGTNGKDGANGKDGTSVTITNVSESTADGGSNVVTFSNGKTLTVKNGSKGSTGAKGDKGDKGDTGAKGADGYTPRREVDYWTPADQEFIVQQVISALGTPVFGRVDKNNNNIILTGELADGTYTFVYEDKDGTVAEVGTITKAPAIINQIPLSINSDGSQYVGDNGEDGYRVGYRLNSSGVEKEQAEYRVTGFIPIKLYDVIRFKNVGYRPTVTTTADYIAVYDSTFKLIASVKSENIESHKYLIGEYTTDAETGYLTSISPTNTSQDYGYIRVSATVLDSNSIITINQEI